MSQWVLALTAASVPVSVPKSPVPVQHLNLLAVWTCPETQKVGHIAVLLRRPIPPRPPLKPLQGLLPPDGR